MGAGGGHYSKREQKTVRISSTTTATNVMEAKTISFFTCSLRTAIISSIILLLIMHYMCFFFQLFLQCFSLGPLLRSCFSEDGAELQNVLWGLYSCLA